MNVRFLTGADEVSRRWHDIAPLFAPVVDAAAHGEFTLADLKALAEAGRLMVGVCEFGGVPLMAMAFEFRHYPRKTLINIVAIGGQHMEFVYGRFWDRFNAFAEAAGAVEFEANVSEAMARLLKKIGFESTYRVVRKKVEAKQ